MEQTASIYDGIIIGAGPAGLSAAIYLARAKCRTLVIEQAQIGGQIALTADVANYPGVTHIDGAALTQTMRQQAEQFGAELLHASATSAILEGSVKAVQTDKGTFRARSILFATGSAPRQAGFLGETKYQGRGGTYCATCVAALFAGKEVFVIGGGYAAAQEAVFLAKYAKHVTICIRKDRFSCAKSVADRALQHPKITVRYHTELIEIGGDDLPRYAILRDSQTKEQIRYDAPPHDTFGVFVFIGYQPQTALFQDQLALTEQGYVKTDHTQKTSIDGVFGAGDVCDKTLRQVVTAVADGAVAATSMERELSAKRKANPIKAAANAQAQTQQKPSDCDALSDESLRRLEHLKKPLVLQIETDRSTQSEEAIRLMQKLCTFSELLRCSIVPAKKDGTQYPAISLYSAGGVPLGLTFHGVPGGHVFDTIDSSICSDSCGDTLAAHTTKAIAALPPMHLEIAVTLSCAMCPPTACAAALLALQNPHIQTDLYDVSQNPDMRNRYQILHVPCIIRDGVVISYGKKSLDEMLALLA